MSNTNPIKSFEPAKCVSPDKFFDRIKAKHVIALVGAVALLIVSMGVSSVSYKLHKEGADALDNHARVEENSELEYYLVVKSDGVDKNGTQSTDSTTANIGGGITTVTDKIPAGLEFIGFKTTETGTIGAVARSDSATSCSGHVIDDTKEEAVNAGTWNQAHTEYYYHGLHYNAETRTVSFKAENIQAGCDLTVGIVTKTPTLGSNTRLDFYNTANLKEGNLNLNSNTFHNWIGVGKEGAETFDVTYTYTGTVPANAPSAPATQGYAENTSVSVEASPSVDGYQFSGWTTSDAVVSSGSFTMPASTVTFTGSFTEKPAGTKYSVTYVIDGGAPADYVVPKTKQYEAGETISLDSLSKNTKIDDWSFNGWTSEDTDLSDKGFTMPARNVEIHGSFTQDTYKVTYAFEGDVLPPNADALLPAEQEYPAGTKVTRAPNPTADGYSFTGWYKNETFIMPEEDVVIYGEWSIQRGTFAPEISIKTMGEKEKYREGDAVVFEISIKNPSDHPITDVQIVEQMDSAYFTENPNYALKNEQFATISEIPAGETKTLYAEYIIPANEDADFTNTVEMIGAIADGYTLDEDMEYVASIDFQSEYWVEPVPDPEDEASGDSSEEKEKEREEVIDDVVNTIDNITHYGMIALFGIAGIIASIFMVMKTLKNEQLQGVKGAIQKTGKIKNFFNPNTATRGRLIALATADLALVAIAIGLAMHLPQKTSEDSANETTINLMSSHADYNSNEDGAWNITKSAKWTGDGEAQLTIEVDTKKKTSDAKKDIVFAVDTSGSMMGDKLAQVKADMSELVEDILSDNENRVALVSFESEAELQFGFTNDKSLALESIESLETGNNTNYYDALSKVEDALAGYSEDQNRELYVLILTDGLPTVGSPNEIGEFNYLKQTYPYATIGAVQYEMNSDGVFAPVARISDEQFIADMSSLHNTLYDVVAFPYTYTSFTITDFINDEYFTVESPDSLYATVGDTSLNGNEVTWDMGGKLRSGSSAKLTVKLKLKDAYKRTAGQYPTNSSISAMSSIEGGEDEDETSQETPILKNNYTVTYDGNAPSDCSVGNLPAQHDYFVYQAVEISENIPTCTGYNFAGYLVMSDVAKRYNDDYFQMPEADVTIKATWTKTDIEKRAEGEVYVARTLYNAIAKRTNGDDNSGYISRASTASEYGVNTYTPSKADDYPIYYYRGVVPDNNILFADHCWKAIRTTSTGGVKVIYNGVPDGSGRCTNVAAGKSGVIDIGMSSFNSQYQSPAGNGYMIGGTYVSKRDSLKSDSILFSSTLGSNSWYADSATYGSPIANKWNLDNAYQVTSSTDYSGLVGKYTFGNVEQAYTNNSVRYIVAISGSTYYYIELSGNTTLASQDWSFTYGDSYVDNGDGTYSITDSTEVQTLKRTDWFSGYEALNNKFICKNATNGFCENLRYATRNTGTSMTYLDPIARNYKYAKSFNYINGEYSLDEETAVSVLNTQDALEVEKLNNAHYTCLNRSGFCPSNTIYYVYFVGSSGDINYITLKDGKNIEEALQEMNSNMDDSSIKTKIDNWYASTIRDTEDEALIEDTAFCNDRTMSNNTNGWVADGGSVRQRMGYSGLRAYNSLFTCDNNNYAFTVSPEIGNGKLSYPVGLISADEARIAGFRGREENSNYLYSDVGYWTITPYYFDALYQSAYNYKLDNWGISNGANPNSNAVRPVISIAPDVLVASGDGSQNAPWELEKP